jgi:hypothetical protein
MQLEARHDAERSITHISPRWITQQQRLACRAQPRPSSSLKSLAVLF